MPGLEASIENARARFLEDPTDIAHAWAYWTALGSLGADVRSGQCVAEAFGPTALSSVNGAIAFARAYEQLFEVSGEAPKAAHVSIELQRALQNALQSASSKDAQVLNWVLQCLKDEVT